MRNKSFILLLLVQTLALVVYTFFAFKNESSNLFEVFTQTILDLNWNGQFNLDFLCYLILSGIWIMWRNEFSIASIFGGLAASILGIVVFAPYLIFLVITEKANFVKVLVGNRI